MNLRKHRRTLHSLALGSLLALAPALTAFTTVAHAASPNLVISQVYGGGGNAGATLKNDFIEILNRGPSAVSVTGWTVQYAAAGGTSWQSTALSGSIPAGGYYLVQEAAGSGGTVNLPTPDASGSIAMSATAGKVALVSSTTLITVSCPTVNVVDFVGFGAANCSETSPMATLSNTTAGLRGNLGCTDTDNNSLDFATGAPNPRNSASAPHSCQYLMNVASAPPAGGSVAKSPDQATYTDGSVVQLTASPATGYHFVNWTGDATGSGNPVSVTMTADRNATANFAPDQHTLTVGTVGSGTVGKSPDQATYDYGSSVQLTATPAVGWHFVGWSGDASGAANPVSVTMDGDKSVTATFALDQHTIAVATVGSGSVAKAPDQATYDYGSSVQLTATADPNWHFVSWSGDATGNANPVSVTMDGDKSVTATFAIDQRALTVATVGSGSVGKSPDQATYDHGSSVQLTASPAVGWHFVGWSGDATGNANPLSVTMDGDKTITATFAIDQHTLALSTTGSGSVGKSPDQATYDYGSSVQLTASPSTGWHFVDWTGDASGGANPISVTMDADKSVTANFGINTHTLAVSTVGSGTVGKSPDQASYDFGSTVQLTATPAVGWHFVGWSGDASGTANPLTVTMDGDKTITATFAIDTHTLAVSTVGSGSVSKAPDQAAYDYGSSVQLSATPDPGWHFVGWGGDASGAANPLSVTMDADKGISATFAPDQHTLAATTAGSGSVAKSPDQATYDHGSSVQLTATPAAHWRFVGWSGDASGNANPLTVTMDGDKTITATFALNTVVVSQVYGGGGNAGATYTNDFIELYNNGPAPMDVTGWTVQYASASGTTWAATALSGVIPPGRYLLVQEAAGAGGTTPLPTPDASDNIAMSATSGKVALVSGSTALSGGCPSGAPIEDLVGYGSASCAETSPTAALTNTTADRRKSGGCIDTDNNSADFLQGAPTPRNSASPANNCLFTLAVLVSPPAGGSVAKSPDLPGYNNGAAVQLTATPVSGYHFDSWSGDATGSSNPLDVTMDSDKTITANFVANGLSGQVVISQVYGGGGNGGATYTHDYVELFNRGNIAVDITGWTLQYAAAGGGPWNATTLIGTIPPGRYYLIQEAQGAGGTTALPAPDAIGTMNLGASDGKVALVNTNVLLVGNCPGSASLVDLLGYGTANCSETAPAAPMDNVTASYRNNGGCDESNDNAVDFSNGVPAPRNSATPVHLCPMWVGVDPTPVTEFALAAPAPNPARGASRLGFALPVEARVRLNVMDVQGRVIESLVDGVLPAGRHEVMWNGSTRGGQVRPGLYFVRLEVPGRRFVRTVVVMR